MLITNEATRSNPKDKFMIFGKYDEYRARMTGTTNFEKEWMSNERTRRVISDPNPQLGVTYGNFSDGTARRVFMPLVIHLQESIIQVPWRRL